MTCLSRSHLLAQNERTRDELGALSALRKTKQKKRVEIYTREEEEREKEKKKEKTLRKRKKIPGCDSEGFFPCSYGCRLGCPDPPSGNGGATGEGSQEGFGQP